MHIDEIYQSETFRLLSQRTKDRHAVNIAFILKMVHPESFAELERVAKDLLQEQEDELAEERAREEEARRPYAIGELTAKLVFQKYNIHNLSDMQRVLNAVEEELVALSNAVTAETEWHGKTREELHQITEANKETIIGVAKELDNLKYQIEQITHECKRAGYVNGESPRNVIKELATRVERLKEEIEATDRASRAIEQYEKRVAVVHEKLFHDDPTDSKERFARFLEEVFELGQVLRINKHEIPKLLDRVYDRPAGHLDKELAQTAMTLGSLCHYLGHSLPVVAHLGLVELEDEDRIRKVREKRKTRHGRGLLPGFDQPKHAQIVGRGLRVVQEETIGSMMRSRDFATGVVKVEGAISGRHVAQLPPEAPEGFQHQFGTPVEKIKGSQWRGHVCGFYSTRLTPEGYAVESDTEKGSVQIYPVAALRVRKEAGESE